MKEERIKEIRLIDWSAVGSRASEKNYLEAKEYLRMAANILSKQGLSAMNPYFGVAKSLNLSDQADELMGMIENTVNTESVLCKYIVAYYLITENAKSEQVSQLYAPLISIFRRGGEVGLDHDGCLTIDETWALPLKNWIERFRDHSE